MGSKCRERRIYPRLQTGAEQPNWTSARNRQGRNMGHRRWARPWLGTCSGKQRTPSPGNEWKGLGLVQNKRGFGEKAKGSRKH